ncbi:UbiA prenyltransferase family-domain-containing protein [Geopyxis carbonaria]|nr:UbiA prenyltransferase family-domain-containing protein [Geopyxis carbonaria]
MAIANMKSHSTIDSIQAQKLSSNIRSTGRACWELARYHTKESMLEVFPAIWGAVFSAGVNGADLDLLRVVRLLASNWASMTLLHGTFCVINDLIDAEIDIHVERTKKRPIPSGRISKNSAWWFFLFMLSATASVTYATLGLRCLQISLPIWVIAGLYPYGKRVVRWPQFVLAPAVAWPAFVGWVSIGPQYYDNAYMAVPLFLSVCIWTIYFDTCYAVQDYKDDVKIGVKSLAVSLQGNVYFFLGVLGTMLISLLSFSSYVAKLSPIMWVGGILVWATSIIHQLKYTLDVKEPKSGGKVFGQNIMLGMYITGVSIVELFYQAAL